MFQTLKSLFESKPFVVALLAVAAAIAAVFGDNVDPTKILAVLTPLMVAIGATGWGEGAAKHKADADVKMHAMTLAAQHVSNESEQKAKVSQAGFARMGLMFIMTILIGGLLISSAGCQAEPVAADVIDCAKAEAQTVAKGASVFAVFAAVVAAIEAGPVGVEAAIEALITKDGPEIVACAIENYPEPAIATGSGSAAPKMGASEAVALKHSLLEKYFSGKKIVVGKN